MYTVKLLFLSWKHNFMGPPAIAWWHPEVEDNPDRYPPFLVHSASRGPQRIYTNNIYSTHRKHNLQRPAAAARRNPKTSKIGSNAVKPWLHCSNSRASWTDHIGIGCWLILVLPRGIESLRAFACLVFIVVRGDVKKCQGGQ